MRIGFDRLASGIPLVVASALALCPVAAQTPTPTPTPTAPPAAYSVGAAYDAGRATLVVFGGYMNGSYVGDTWEWDGRAWKLVTSQGPSARNSPTLVYDEARRQIVDVRRGHARGWRVRRHVGV